MSQYWPWPECFLRRLKFDGDCLVPTGAVESNGYWRIRVDGRRVQAHRAMWELMVGPIPDGLEPDHTCRNRACVNVGHLELVTHRENVLRGDSPTAVNARKTHCVHGHEFDEKNTRCRPGGGRSCRACEAGRRRGSRKEKKS